MSDGVLPFVLSVASFAALIVYGVEARASAARWKSEAKRFQKMSDEAMIHARNAHAMRLAHRDECGQLIQKLSDSVTRLRGEKALEEQEALNEKTPESP